jgi:hypothetical protein
MTCPAIRAHVPDASKEPACAKSAGEAGAHVFHFAFRRSLWFDGSAQNCNVRALRNDEQLCSNGRANHPREMLRARWSSWLFDLANRAMNAAQKPIERRKKCARRKFFLTAREARWRTESDAVALDVIVVAACDSLRASSRIVARSFEKMPFSLQNTACCPCAQFLSRVTLRV